MDVIYEYLLKEGFNLNSKVESLKIGSNILFKITDGESNVVITLDQEIGRKTIDELHLTKESLFICLDSALNDSTKANIGALCILKTL
jgi:adenine-specific DNA-methyltransferase